MTASGGHAFRLHHSYAHCREAAEHASGKPGEGAQDCACGRQRLSDVVCVGSEKFAWMTTLRRRAFPAKGLGCAEMWGHSIVGS